MRIPVLWGSEVTFLNAILLAGTSALLVPLVIHLFHRSKPKVVYWGAMHLLEQALLENKRRLNLENLLLLIIRCLIPFLLALCMARPVFTKFNQLLGEAKSSVVVVMDDSYSMAAVTAGQSAYEEAQEAVSELLDAAGRGTEINVVMAGGDPRPVLDNAAYDNVLVNREIEERSPVQGVSRWSSALEQGIGMLADMTQPVRDVIWVSDFQKVNFKETAGTSMNRVAAMAEESAVQPRLVLFPVGDLVENNVAVTELKHSKLLQGVGQDFPIRATVRNFGDKEWTSLEVILRVDGEEASTQRLQLKSREEVTVHFDHVFEKAGSHLIEVMADADELEADNIHRASLSVSERLDVLLVSGESSNEILKSETDYLEMALAPYRAGSGKKNLVSATTISSHQFNPAQIGGKHIIVLANVIQLSGDLAVALQKFVENGGGLIVFPGSRIQVDWYNKVMGLELQLLPLKIESLEGEDTGTTRVAAQRYDNPALDFFNDERNGKLSDALIRIWYKTSPLELNGQNSPSVLAQFEGGQPFLAERKYGRGKVLQFSVPCDADWSNLPMRPFYLPLMQRMVAYLASASTPPRNLKPGEMISAHFPAREAGREMILETPTGDEVGLQITGGEGSSVVEYDQTLDAGVYKLKIEPSPPLYFVVQPSYEESDLQRLTD
ncbi:MAG: BatA domain-containing protein, partial [Limisphaerales bacterium]